MENFIFYAVGYTEEKTSLGKVFETWSNLGFFNYVLPFLLIFAIVFGMLQKMKPFEIKEEPKQTKMINALIAVVVGLITIQFSAVPKFFSVAFPKFGMALSILLIGALLMAMTQGSRIKFVMFISLIVLGGIFAIGQTLVPYLGYNFLDYEQYLIFPALIIGAIVWMVWSSGRKKEKSPKKEEKKDEKKEEGKEDKKNKLISFE